MWLDVHRGQTLVSPRIDFVSRYCRRGNAASPKRACFETSSRRSLPRFHFRDYGDQCLCTNMKRFNRELFALCASSLPSQSCWSPVTDLSCGSPRRPVPSAVAASSMPIRNLGCESLQHKAGSNNCAKHLQPRNNSLRVSRRNASGITLDDALCRNRLDPRCDSIVGSARRIESGDIHAHFEQSASSREAFLAAAREITTRLQSGERREVIRTARPGGP